MQEHVSVSSTVRMVVSSACSVTVRSSTSTGVLVYSTRLVPRSAQRLMWLSGYLRSARAPSGLSTNRPSRPTATVTRSDGPSSGSRLTLKRAASAFSKPAIAGARCWKLA